MLFSVFSNVILKVNIALSQIRNQTPGAFAVCIVIVSRRRRNDGMRLWNCCNHNIEFPALFWSSLNSSTNPDESTYVSCITKKILSFVGLPVLSQRKWSRLVLHSLKWHPQILVVCTLSMHQQLKHRKKGLLWCYPSFLCKLVWELRVVPIKNN